MTLKSNPLLLLVPLFAALLACESSQARGSGDSHDDVDAGGRGGASGSGVTGGNTTGGNTTGGNTMTGGAPADGGPACPSAPEHRSTVLYVLSNVPETPAANAAELGGEGGASGAGGAGDGGAGDGGTGSGCSRVMDFFTCTGRVRSALIEGAPAFVFDDGSTLTFTGTLGGDLEPPTPPVGVDLWIDYAGGHYRSCPYCSDITQLGISIRAGEGGERLFVGTAGPSNFSDGEALFGVPLRFERLCDEPLVESICSTSFVSRNDVVLETSPETRVLFAATTRVVTPPGTFDVFWASEDVTAVRNPNVYDCDPPFASGWNAFAARRVQE